MYICYLVERRLAQLICKCGHNCAVGIDWLTARMCEKTVASGSAMLAMTISKQLVCIMQSCCLSFTNHNKSVDKEDNGLEQAA